MSKQLILVLLIALFGSLIESRSNHIALKKSTTPSNIIRYSGFLGNLSAMERVDVDFPYFARADIGDERGLLVAISLFNSHVFLSNCPPVYRLFNCSASEDTCVSFPHIIDHADFPYYSIDGYRILVNMTLGNFGRGMGVKALYANQCTKNCYNNDELVGSVGFSLNNSNILNFDTSNNMFSVWLERDGSDGELIFGEDSGHETDEPFVTLNAVNENWEVPLSVISMLDNVYSLGGNAIFDINSNFIGIPEHIHFNLKRDLKHRFNFICVRRMITPNCSFEGDINSLPPLLITHADGYSVMKIPPTVYTRKLDDNLYSFMLVSLKMNAMLPHQLNVTEYYKDFIVLGAPFLQYYYTVFNYTNPLSPTIRLFVPSQSFVGGLSAWAIIGIILGALLLIGIIVGSVMAFKKNREKKRQESLVNPESRVGYISYNQ